VLQDGERQLGAAALENRRFGGYRFRNMRWIGLAKANCQVHLAIIAYNIKRYLAAANNVSAK
jgi:hypothetical protein